jgi:hypothetical protein
MSQSDVTRNLGNFSSVPAWNTTMTEVEVEYMFSINDTTVICNGLLRDIQVDKITDNCFKVYTKARSF